jgi:hypothetical protein
VAFFLGPSIGFHSFFVADRFSVLLVPTALAALRAGDGRDRRIARAITVVAAVAWMAVLGVRFAGFDREMASAEHVWRQMMPGRRLTSLVYQPLSRSVRATWAMIHVGAWAQSEKGGTFDMSFAFFPNLPIQYRPGKMPEHTMGLELEPDAFDWKTDGTADYFLVQSPPAQYPLANPPVPLMLVAREGPWSLYRRLDGPAAGFGSRHPNE